MDVYVKIENVIHEPATAPADDDFVTKPVVLVKVVQREVKLLRFVLVVDLLEEGEVAFLDHADVFLVLLVWEFPFEDAPVVEAEVVVPVGREEVVLHVLGVSSPAADLLRVVVVDDLDTALVNVLVGVHRVDTVVRIVNVTGVSLVTFLTLDADFVYQGF